MLSLSTELLAGTFAVDAAHSTLGFSIAHLKVATFTATFDDIECTLVADGKGIQLTGSIGVESVSIRTPPGFREHVVYGGEFFDANRFPRILFRSSNVSLSHDGRVLLEGELTLKGITHSFQAIGTWQPPTIDPWGGTRIGTDIGATIDRRQWGMTYQLPMPDGSDAVGYQVRINAHLELIRSE